MTVASLNNAAITSAAYTDAATVVFPFPRDSFALQIYNAAIYYQVGAISGQHPGGDVSWEPLEHFLVPTYNTFTDAPSLGFAPGFKFMGIRLKAAAAAAPARVTVL